MVDLGVVGVSPFGVVGSRGGGGGGVQGGSRFLSIEWLPKLCSWYLAVS